MWPTPTIDGNYNRKGASPSSGDGLASAVAKFPMPGLVTHRAMQSLPTPNACQGNNVGTLQEWGGSGNPIRKTDPELARAPLNPVWVAWLMGWPHAEGWDWTSLAPAPAELMEMTWEREPPIPRVGKGIPNRVQRLRALGNGQVPQCAAAAWRLLSDAM